MAEVIKHNYRLAANLKASLAYTNITIDLYLFNYTLYTQCIIVAGALTRGALYALLTRLTLAYEQIVLKKVAPT